MSLWSWDHFPPQFMFLLSLHSFFFFLTPHLPSISHHSSFSLLVYIFKFVLLMSAWVGSGTLAVLVLHLAPAAPRMFFHPHASPTWWGEKSVLISLPTWESASRWGIFCRESLVLGEFFCILGKVSGNALLFFSLGIPSKCQERNPAVYLFGF